MVDKKIKDLDDSDQVHICDDTQSYFEQVYADQDFSDQESENQEYWPSVDEERDYIEVFCNIEEDNYDLTAADYIEIMESAEKAYREQSDVEQDCEVQDYGAGFSGGYNGLLDELKVCVVHHAHSDATFVDDAAKSDVESWTEASDDWVRSDNDGWYYDDE